MQIEPSEMVTHANESMMLIKCFICTDLPYKQSAFDEL